MGAGTSSSNNRRRDKTKHEAMQLDEWLRPDCHELYYREMVGTGGRSWGGNATTCDDDDDDGSRTNNEQRSSISSSRPPSATCVTKRGRLIRFGLTQSLGVVRRYRLNESSSSSSSNFCSKTKKKKNNDTRQQRPPPPPEQQTKCTGRRRPLFLEFGVHEGKDIARIASFLAVQEQQQQQKKKNGSAFTADVTSDEDDDDDYNNNTTTATTAQFVVHGFDSFEGLPEDWYNGQYRDISGENNDDDDDDAQKHKDDNNDTAKRECVYKAGTFNLDGQSPQLDELQASMTFWKCGGQRRQLEQQQIDNQDTETSNDTTATIETDDSMPSLHEHIEFHKGWFEDTVPEFFANQQSQHHHQQQPVVAFIHADADLYSSTIAFLKVICEYKLLVKGSIIVFDEYWNYENWQHQGEYQAWNDIVEQYNIHYKYIGYHGPAAPAAAAPAAAAAAAAAPSSTPMSPSIDRTATDTGKTTNTNLDSSTLTPSDINTGLTSSIRRRPPTSPPPLKKRLNTYGYQSVCIMITKDM